MRERLAIIPLLAVALGACSTTRAVEVEPGPVRPGPQPPTAAALPAGTMLTVQLDQNLSTDRSRVGERFTATVTEPLVAQSGEVAVPRGSRVSGVITGLSPSANARQPAAVRLNFDRLEVRGRSHPFAADVVETNVRARYDERRIARDAGIGALAGAGLGAVLGGSLRDALIGGALGAGVGSIISLGFGTVDAEIPAGSVMTLQTTQQVSLR